MKPARNTTGASDAQTPGGEGYADEPVDAPLHRSAGGSPDTIPTPGRAALFLLGTAIVAYGLAEAEGDIIYVIAGGLFALVRALGSISPLTKLLIAPAGALGVPVEETRARVEQDALIQDLSELRGTPDYSQRRDLNARQMRVYQDLSTGQAKSSYRRSQFAFLVGLGLIVAAVVLALSEEAQPPRSPPAALQG
jgi:hypothetical protein